MTTRASSPSSSRTTRRKRSPRPIRGRGSPTHRRAGQPIGYTDADWAEIEDGLTEGDLVVTVGGDGIRAEAEVKLPGDPNPKKPKDDDEDDDDDDDDDKDGESE